MKDKAITQGIVYAPKNSENEILRLSEGINVFVEHIISEKEERYRISTQQMRERLLLLQSQINPHFLYNNLECIRGMALLGNTESIREIVVCMASLYRYCIQADDNTCISDEIRSVRDYMRIMEIRYDTHYEVIYDIPESLMNETVLCMMLQPLVENCIRHGFCNGTVSEGTIKICAKKEDNALYITVSDNGRGMSDEDIMAANKKLVQITIDKIDIRQDHIGLSNINMRLYLRFGKGSGLTLTKNSAGGLDVKIHYSAIASE